MVTHQHIDHTGLLDVARAPLRARRSRPRPARRLRRDYGEASGTRTRSPRVLMVRYGVPRTSSVALRRRVGGVPRLGLARVRRSPAARTAGTDAARPHLEVCTGPGTARPTPPSGTPPPHPVAADHLIAHISSNPLMSRGHWHRGDDPYAPIATGPGARGLPGFDAPHARTRRSSCSPGTETHRRPRDADRRAHRDARAARGAMLALVGGRAANRPTRSRPSSGAMSR